MKYSVCCFFLFLNVCILLHAQNGIPTARYDFSKDTQYLNHLQALKTEEKAKPSLKLMDSISHWASLHKDWETVIDFTEKAIALEESVARYYRLGGAAGFRALEVLRPLSLPYVKMMRHNFSETLRLNPNFVPGLRAMVEVKASIPKILGGSRPRAFEFAERLKVIDPIEGFIALGYLYEMENDLKSAEEAYRSAFTYLKNKNGGCDATLLEQLNKHRPRLRYEVGVAFSTFLEEYDWAICLLTAYHDRYTLSYTVPKEWVFYALAQATFHNNQKELATHYLKKALALRPDFKKALDLKNRMK